MYSIGLKYLRCLGKKILYLGLSFMSVFFILSVRYWNRVGQPFFVNSERFSAIPQNMQMSFINLYRLCVPFCGIAFIILCSVLMSRYMNFGVLNIIKKAVVYLGTITLEIYAVHFYCFGFIGGLANKHIEIIADFMVAVFMSVAVCELLKGCILYKLVFGKMNVFLDKKRK